MTLKTDVDEFRTGVRFPPPPQKHTELSRAWTSSGEEHSARRVVAESYKASTKGSNTWAVCFCGGDLVSTGLLILTFTIRGSLTPPRKSPGEKLTANDSKFDQRLAA